MKPTPFPLECTMSYNTLRSLNQLLEQTQRVCTSEHYANPTILFREIYTHNHHTIFDHGNTFTKFKTAACTDLYAALFIQDDLQAAHYIGYDTMTNLRLALTCHGYKGTTQEACLLGLGIMLHLNDNLHPWLKKNQDAANENPDSDTAMRSV